MASLLIAVIFSLLTLLEAHLTLLRQLSLSQSFSVSSLDSGTIEDDKNDSVESRQNLDGSGQDQDKLQRFGTALICREESNGERIGEGDYKRI